MILGLVCAKVVLQGPSVGNVLSPSQAGFTLIEQMYEEGMQGSKIGEEVPDAATHLPKSLGRVNGHWGLPACFSM